MTKDQPDTSLLHVTCEDIIFAVIDDSIRKMEPVIIGFKLEANCLTNLSMNLSHIEKSDFVRRSHMAKKMMMQFRESLNVKYDFLKVLKKKRLISKKMKVLLRFLKGRLNNSRILMRKSECLINLSVETFDHMVDNAINDNS
jgi:Mg2+ and Co2+ transporter CorA